MAEIYFPFDPGMFLPLVELGSHIVTHLGWSPVVDLAELGAGFLLAAVALRQSMVLDQMARRTQGLESHQLLGLARWDDFYPH